MLWGQRGVNQPNGESRSNQRGGAEELREDLQSGGRTLREVYQKSDTESEQEKKKLRHPTPEKRHREVATKLATINDGNQATPS